MIKNFLTSLIGLLLGLFIFIVGLIAVAVMVTYPKLPSLDAVKHYQPKEPLTIYSSDGVLIGIYGDERRAFTPISEFPVNLRNAVIAAEDKRFYEHWGVDVAGIGRAVISNLTGGVKSGASTITQQVARNFYLTNERTMTRKFNEALLAYKIEKELTKNQILELYFNQIYLGQRAYGFTAASQIYFNKPVQNLTLAEATILAGLPKAPSAFNPIVNPERARQRQEYILNNMVELNMITPAQRNEALNEKLHYERQRVELDENSHYVAEMVRQNLYDKYGENAYSQGLKVYTTVSTANQKAATAALRKALLNFDRGRAYRGAEDQLDINTIDTDDMDEKVEQYLSNTYTVERMVPAVVVKADKKGIDIRMQGGIKAHLNTAQMGIARHAVGSKKLGNKAIQAGSVIRVMRTGNKRWTVVQQPEIQGALVSLDAETGAIRALVGGFDFHNKSFNRATQGMRQPGSTFKPFVYSAALSRGMTAATLVNDAPLKIGNWQPKNSDGVYAGMITLRQALAKSKNTVTVRIAQAMGTPYVHSYVQRFGFQASQIPSGLALALGTGSTTPLQMAEGYAVFANGGYKVSGYIIDKIYDSKGRLKAEMHPLVAKQNAPQVIDPRNAYIMTSMLQDVIRHGTGHAANALGRSDIAGKTGTTNDNKDAWFVGFNPKVVTAVYIGYDKPASMGRSAFGGTVALPVWVNYMRFALNGKAVQNFQTPNGITQSDGELFLNEQQVTSESIHLDNSTSDPEAVQRSQPASENAADSDTGENDVPPPPPSNVPERTSTPDRTSNNNNESSVEELF